MELTNFVNGTNSHPNWDDWGQNNGGWINDGWDDRWCCDRSSIE
ncbi:MAG: hypothetical protein QXD62_02585 [Candidatus Woesearchaeota archaeon]